MPRARGFGCLCKTLSYRVELARNENSSISEFRFHRLHCSYLTHVRSTASAVDQCAASSSSPITAQQRKSKWFKHLTHLVKRCLTSVPCKRSHATGSFTGSTRVDDFYTDYSFHNKVLCYFSARNFRFE